MQFRIAKWRKFYSVMKNMRPQNMTGRWPCPCQRCLLMYYWLDGREECGLTWSLLKITWTPVPAEGLVASLTTSYAVCPVFFSQLLSFQLWLLPLGILQSQPQAKKDWFLWLLLSWSLNCFPQAWGGGALVLHIRTSLLLPREPALHDGCHGVVQPRTSRKTFRTNWLFCNEGGVTPTHLSLPLPTSVAKLIAGIQLPNQIKLALPWCNCLRAPSGGEYALLHAGHMLGPLDTKQIG